MCLGNQYLDNEGTTDTFLLLECFASLRQYPGAGS